MSPFVHAIHTGINIFTDRLAAKVVFSQACAILFTREGGVRGCGVEGECGVEVGCSVDGVSAQGVSALGVWLGRHPPEMATAVFGTYPTGMHSRFKLKIVKQQQVFLQRVDVDTGYQICIILIKPAGWCNLPRTPVNKGNSQRFAVTLEIRLNG